MAEQRREPGEPRETPAKLYERLEHERHDFLSEAEENEDLTMPVGAKVGDPDDHQPYHESVSNKNTIGVSVVQGLASTLLSTMFPSQTPFFDLRLDGPGVSLVRGDKDTANEISEEMADARRQAIWSFEKMQLKSAFYNALRGALVAGQVVVHLNKDDKARLYPLSAHVTEYEGEKLRRIVVREVDGDKQIFTDVDFEENVIRQEIKNSKAGTSITKKVKADDDKPIQWILVSTEPPLPGDNYSRAYTTYFAPKLNYVNELTYSIQTIMQQAKRLIIGYRPGRGINPKELEKNGLAVLPMMDEQDLFFPSLDRKVRDMAVAMEEREKCENELKREFLFGLLERRPLPETATLAREMIAELNALGAQFFAHLADSVQRPLARALLAVNGFELEADNATLEPIVLTGATALSKQEQALRIVQTMQMLLSVFPEMSQEMDRKYIAKRVFEGFDIETEHLFVDQPGGAITTDTAQQGTQPAEPASPTLDINQVQDALLASQGVGNVA